MLIQICFHPNIDEPGIIPKIELQGPDEKKLLFWANSGSNFARNSALNSLEGFRSHPNLTVEKMQNLHEVALKIAIDEAEKHKKGEYSECGGELFFQPSRS